MSLAITIGASLVNNFGDLLPHHTYSTQATMRESWAERSVVPYEKFEEMGGRVVTVLLLEMGSEEEMVAAIRAWVRSLEPPPSFSAPASEE